MAGVVVATAGVAERGPPALGAQRREAPQVLGAQPARLDVGAAGEQAAGGEQVHGRLPVREVRGGGRAGMATADDRDTAGMGPQWLFGEQGPSQHRSAVGVGADGDDRSHGSIPRRGPCWTSVSAGRCDHRRPGRPPRRGGDRRRARPGDALRAAEPVGCPSGPRRPGDGRGRRAARRAAPCAPGRVLLLSVLGHFDREQRAELFTTFAAHLDSGRPVVLSLQAPASPTAVP